MLFFLKKQMISIKQCLSAYSYIFFRSVLVSNWAILFCMYVLLSLFHEFCQCTHAKTAIGCRRDALLSCARCRHAMIVHCAHIFDS